MPQEYLRTSHLCHIRTYRLRSVPPRVAIPRGRHYATPRAATPRAATPRAATPRVATPRVHHYRSIRYPKVGHPCPFFLPSTHTEFRENGKYISCASIEAGLMKIIVQSNRSSDDNTNSFCK